ncbi:cupin domain-containing protein [Halorarius halobius]|uniref:cupin domain-containing protein n=1 Tax=Halorarius halobius TaxID=2962671 RepID=UPI0020CBC4CC|nr:cupin domain-containing protein [Halorarius halobius]
MADDVVALDALDGTVAPVFDGDPRVVRLSLSAGEERPRHSHPDRVVVCHVVEGRLDLRLDGDPLEVGAGELVRFDGAREVAPRALDDTRAVLVLAATS